MISQDVKVSFLFLILNGFFHPKTFVNDTILKCCRLIYFGRFNFFFSKYHHRWFVSHVFVAVTVLVFQRTAKFISVTEIHTYVINEMKKKVFNIFVSSHVHVLISLLFCHHIPEKLNTSISDRSTRMFSLCVFNFFSSRNFVVFVCI